jgi:hypothetical protein
VVRPAQTAGSAAARTSTRCYPRWLVRVKCGNDPRGFAACARPARRQHPHALG